MKTPFKLLTMLTTMALSTALTLATFTSTAQANDGAYYMSGNQLVPMHTTQIDVKKEVLDIRREGEDIVVDVHYELYNSGKPLSLLVGFEAFPPEGDVTQIPKDGKHPYMKDFTARINGKSLQYDVALVSIKDKWQQIDGEYTLDLDKATTPFYFQNGHIKQVSESTILTDSEDSDQFYGLYVYHFSADFKSGKNIIDHSYRFEASGSVYASYTFDYVLKAINRWGDSTIDDFQLNIDMGEMTEFNLANSFFDSADDWQIDGIGKAYPINTDFVPDYYDGKKQGSSTFSMRKGKISFKQKNFTPKGDIFLISPSHVSYGESFDANKHDLSFNYSWIDNDESSDFSQKVLRNFPYARHGYIFKNRKLQAYFEKQPWYIADPSYKADFSKLENEEKEYIEALKK